MRGRRRRVQPVRENPDLFPRSAHQRPTVKRGLDTLLLILERFRVLHSLPDSHEVASESYRPEEHGVDNHPLHPSSTESEVDVTSIKDRCGESRDSRNNTEI